MQAILKDATQGIADRRLIMRVRAAWEACCDSETPSWAAMREADLGDDWASCFAIDLNLSAPGPYFLFVGDALESFADMWVRERGASEQSVIDLLASSASETALKQVPATVEKVFMLDQHRRIAMRALLLPLSDDGNAVTHVFGAAGGRVLGGE